jgi:hypothetical protein
MGLSGVAALLKLASDNCSPSGFQAREFGFIFPGMRILSGLQSINQPIEESEIMVIGNNRPFRGNPTVGHEKFMYARQFH